MPMRGIRGTVDPTARDWIVELALRGLLNTGVASGLSVGGRLVELATDECGATSTGETYVAPGSIGYYHNPAGFAQVSTAGATIGGDMTDGGGVAAAFDGNLSQDTATGAFRNSGAATGSVTAQLAASKRVTKFAFTSLNTYGFSNNAAEYNANVITLTGYGSNDGSSWTQLCQQTGINNTQGVAQRVEITVGAPGDYLHYKGEVSRTGGGNVWPGLSEVQLYEETAPADMTIIPATAVVMASAVDFAEQVFLYRDDSGSAAAGVDLRVWLSGDGGANWDEAAIQTLVAYDATYSILKARAPLLTSRGGSILYKTQCLNGKAQRIGPHYFGGAV